MILLTGGTFFPLSSGARLTSHLGDLSWYQAVIASIAKTIKFTLCFKTQPII